MIDEQHPEPALARMRGAEQTGGTGSDDDGVEMMECVDTAETKKAGCPLANPRLSQLVESGLSPSRQTET
ncbi:hypothetical protein [Diaphorobacter aerolatus]|uniref:hypothetical protein n=1 Tax=Diaphorobacter aerolatus TaxID=1288495 RepID=UPI001D007927|nr:hypothetical protein [Diaphorobacter aerolatus]